MAKTKKDSAEGGAVEARVLFGCELGNTNDVVTVQADQIDALVAAGFIDPHPDAVEYAKSLKA